MSSLRLYADQIERLKALPDGIAGEAVRCAVRRWKRGEFVIGPIGKEKNRERLLQVFSIWKKPEGVTDAEVRAILDVHFATPMKFGKTIQALDRQINRMIENLPDYTVEKITAEQDENDE